MIALTSCDPADWSLSVLTTLSLTADDRTRSRHYFESDDGQGLHLRLSRGTVLRHGDILRSVEGIRVRVLAKPEPVLTVTGQGAIDLLRAAYHLGNRHVALEVTEQYLRLSPDPVLQDMLEHMGLQVVEEIAAFAPEAGAYGHSHAPAHSSQGKEAE